MAINVLKEAPDKVAIALAGMGAETVEIIIREHRAEIDRLEAELQAAVAAEREACATVAEAKAQDYLSPEYATGQPFSSHAERFACKQVAEAIRTRR